MIWDYKFRCGEWNVEGRENREVQWIIVYELDGKGCRAGLILRVDRGVRIRIRMR